MDSKPPGKPPAVPATKVKPKRKRRPPAVPWKKPKDMPRRPLSAYNLFFRQERERLLKGGWKAAAKAAKKQKQHDELSDTEEGADDKSKTGGFANLARTVAAKWKTLPADEKAPFEKEAAREKARYDAQMLHWRALQEQKKAQKAGGAHLLEALTSGASLQAYAAQLKAATQPQVEYPDTWFQATDTQRAENLDAAIHMLEIKEQQQQRALLQMQQQQQQQERLQQSSMSEMPALTRRNSAFAISGYQPNDDIQMEVDHLHSQQQQLLASETKLQMEDESPHKKQPAKLPARGSLWSSTGRPEPFPSSNMGASHELRGEVNPMRRPSLLEQISGGVTVGGLLARPPSLLEQRGSTFGGMPVDYQTQFRQLGEESSITAEMLQQSFFGGAGGFQDLNQPRLLNFGEQEAQPQPRAGRIEHRSSIGMPPGYQPPSRQFEQTQRIVRSQSFPSSLVLSPRNTSPEEVSASNRARLPLSEPRGSVGLEPPLTPMFLQSPRPQLSPHSTAHSILNSPNMVPTPPQTQGGDTLMSGNSPRDGMQMQRPLSAPPPDFPGDEEFQPLETPRNSNRRQTFQISRRNQQRHQSGAEVGGMRHQQRPHNDAEVGEIRLCEEMAAEMNRATPRQQQDTANLFQSTFEALDSEDAVDFLSTLKFDQA